MNKVELRALYRQIRLRMSPAEVKTKSRIIGRRLLNEIDWNSYDSICAFEPIAGLNEVDINGVTERLKAQRRNLTILPSDKKAEMPAERFDLIIIPCLAYDADNYRLGWGGGWYDKFLAGQTGAYKLGVCFGNGFAQAGLPHETHDIPLDKVISDI